MPVRSAASLGFRDVAERWWGTGAHPAYQFLAATLNSLPRLAVVGHRPGRFGGDMHVCMCGWIDGWVDRYLDGWMDGMDVGMDGLKDR